MRAVIDVGCKTYGGESSVEYLAGVYEPHVLHGFDPAAVRDVYWLQRTLVVIWPLAAWTFDGTVGFVRGGTRGTVGEGDVRVGCIDLARFLRRLDADEVVLKLDAEGAEYTLLPHLAATNTDRLLKEALVEWHCRVCGNGGGHREGCDDGSSAALRADIERYWRPSVELKEWTR